MTTQINKKQVNIVSDVNLNNNNIYNANINYSNVSNKPKINGIELTGDRSSSVLGLQNKLNEFTITKSIFDNYKNQYNVADLKQIITDYDLQGIVNLNNFNYFIDNLTLDQPFYMFKNGYLVFDSTGNDSGCGVGLILDSTSAHFIDCRILGPKIESNDPLISLTNGSFIHFQGGSIELAFVNQKNFIETSDSDLVRFENITVGLSARDHDYSYAEGANNFGIIGIKATAQGCSVECINSEITIKNDVADDGVDLNSYFISTDSQITADIRLFNTVIKMYGNEEDPKSLDINLDNTEVDIINSTIDGNIYVRKESEKLMQTNTEYNQDDELYAVVDALNSWTDTDDAIASITVNNTTFSQEADGSGFYEFTYDGSDWNLQYNEEDEGTVDLTDYGISYTLQSGEQLYDGCNIKIDYNHDIVIGLRVLQNFTSAATIDLDYVINLIENDIVERTGIRAINNFTNSIVLNNIDPIDFFIEYKKGITALNDIYTNNVFTNRIKAEEAQISILNVNTEDFFIPISDPHLQSNNVKDAISELASENSIPSQTGQSGKFLTTNGTSMSWATVQGGGGSTTTWFSSCSIDNASSTTATDVAVDSRMFTDHIATNGLYTFSYNGASWSLDNATVSLDTYGISFDGSATSGDTIIVSLNSIAGYTLSTGINTINTVLINGLEQVPLVHYRVNNGTITFSTPLVISDYVGVR